VISASRLNLPRLPLFIAVVALLVIGTFLILHRHWVYEVPLLYGETQTIWSVEASVEFNADGNPVRVSMARPGDQKGFTVLKEAGASPGYGLNFIDDGEDPRAEWTIRAANGRQELFYRVEVLESQQPGVLEELSPPEVRAVSWPEPYATAVNSVLSRAYSTSADNFSLARELLKRFADQDPDQDLQLLATHYSSKLPELLVDMLNKASVPSSLVYGLPLQDGRRRQQLVPMLRVWSDNGSKVFHLPGEKQDLLTDESTPMLLWEQHGAPVLDVMGGRDSGIRFSMLRREESTYANIADNLSSQHDFLNFSIHSLPLEEQAMFKTILLIPIGALVVCILRILIGLRTSGTFMPVLIALAFIQTSLVTGLVGFLLVVSTGLFIRSYLSKLNLLLVARITAVIITVIAIIGIFSVLSYKIGLTEGLKITFFPMIILSWTIERMSILWEEEGGREVMVQGGGSLLTAVLAYWAMNDPWIRHLTFNFIGVQFIVLALVLMIGSYTGYRLLELRRFASFGS